MEINKFRNTYHLELIPASHAGIHLGDLVWSPLFGAPLFSRKGMPNTIYNAFLDAGLITEEEWKLFADECNSARLLEARIADKNIEVNTELVPDLLHPELGRIQDLFQFEQIRKFTFGKLQVREMNDMLRVKIDRHLELLKEGNWKEYDGKIRRVHMITELFYGTIKIVIENAFSNSFELALEKTMLQASSKLKGSSSVEYSFSNRNVPFAMRIEAVRTFNG